MSVLSFVRSLVHFFGVTTQFIVLLANGWRLSCALYRSENTRSIIARRGWHRGFATALRNDLVQAIEFHLKINDAY